MTNKQAGGVILDIYTYTYDNANNQKTKHEIIAGVTKGTTIYTYDVLNRLETVTEPSGKKTSYTYDKAGNRASEVISSSGENISNIYTYNEQNRLTEITTAINGRLSKSTHFEYDNNGNQLATFEKRQVQGETEPLACFIAYNTYDKLNQLIKTVTSDGSTLTNTYNGERLRVSKNSGGDTTYFLYEYDKVVLELYSSGLQKARNLYGTNLLMRTSGADLYYYLYNGHADVTALIDQNGSIEATYYYDAFGNIIEQTGDVNNSITYSGYQYDEETGLYYLNARMYDPKIARFLQEDTYRGNPNDPLSLNLYTYCHNNPIVYWDPTGHWREENDTFITGELADQLRYYNKASDAIKTSSLYYSPLIDQYAKLQEEIHNISNAIRFKYAIGDSEYSNLKYGFCVDSSDGIVKATTKDVESSLDRLGFGIDSIGGINNTLRAESSSALIVTQ